jgi:carbon monoxide dehydrogenase subunit G
MRIANEFRLDVPLDEAWSLLTDLERVAPAMPGVTVDGASGDDLRATMRVKVGPIGVAYATTVTLESADEGTRTAVLKASGKERRGHGTVAATVTAGMRESGPGATVVSLTTDLAVTGRVAQFGGGVLQEVADRLLKQFAERLVTQLREPAPEDRPAPAVAPAPEVPAEPAPLAAAGLLRPSAATSGAVMGAFAGGFAGVLLAALLLRHPR